MILAGDCCRELAAFEAGTFDAIVTDPPYGLGMAAWDALPSAAMLAEWWRVLRPGAPLVAFGATRTFHRLFMAAEEQGFVIEDTVLWLHGEGFPKGKRLKPGWEPVMVARRPGAGELQIDAARSEAGRWPANVALDEGAAALLDEQSGEVGNGWAENYGERYAGEGRQYGGGSFGGGAFRGGTTYADAGGASRFFYCPKATQGERHAGLADGERNDHPTVKPIELMRWLMRLVAVPGSRVLDPCAGSGTTGCAAALEGIDFTGIELDEEMAAVARQRVEFWSEHREGVSVKARAEDAAARRRVASAGQESMW